MNQEIYKLHEEKYLKYKKEQKIIEYTNILKIIDLSTDKINYIIENNIIEKIQSFFRKYRLSDKQCINIEDIFGYSENDIIKIRIKDNVFGYHYLAFQKHFELNGYSDLKYNLPIDAYNLRRINKIIKNKSNYIYEKKTDYIDIQGYYNFISNWEFNDLLDILEQRGIQKISTSEELFNKMVSYEPGVYALEIITNDKINFNKSYCIFEDFPTDEEVINFPIGVYNQLKIKPNENNFKIRIVKPNKGTKIKLKCFINSDKDFKDIKHQLTIEFSKHKILSLNQIICVESDVNHSIIPFLITSLYPSNIIDITDIDLEIDFDECFDYDNIMESLLIYLQNE